MAKWLEPSQTPPDHMFARGHVLKIDPFEAGYLMGLIVGEGCFAADRLKPFVAVRLHERDPEPLLRLQRSLGGVLYGPYRYVGNDGTERRSRVWMLYGRELEAAIPFLYEYLPRSHKREQFENWLNGWWSHFDRLNRRRAAPEMEEVLWQYGLTDFPWKRSRG